MKNIIIIGAYPNEPYKMKMLGDCIDRVKPLGYDIMVVSHFPISEEIQEKVNYVVYDGENLLLNSELTPRYKFFSEDFNFIDKPVQGHVLAICKNIVNGINFSNGLGYDFFFYMESDNLIGEKDLFKIELLRQSMICEGKDMVFFNYENEGSPIYETLMFGGNVSYYVKNHNLPLKESDMEDEVSLERRVYGKYENIRDNIYVIDIPSKEYFSNSEVNLESVKYIVSVCLSNKFPHHYLFLQNLDHNPSKIDVIVNGGDVEELYPMVWNMKPIHDKTLLDVKVICDGIEKCFVYSEQDFSDHFKMGYVHFY